VTTAVHVADVNCYRRGCRREECRAADRLDRKQAELRRLRGISGHIPGPVVAAHLRYILDSGRTRLDIAAESGVSDRAIRYILGGQPKVQRPKALALLAVQPLDEAARLDATGTRRRVQALAAVGWPIAWTAEQAGHGAAYLFAILAGKVPTVTSTTARRIAALCRSHGTRPGPSEYTRAVARRNGWHSIAAWDDNIDNPSATPEQSEPYEAAPKYERDPDRKAEIEHLYLLGESIPAMAKQLGNTEKYIRDQLAVILRERQQRAEQERAAKAGLERAA
jgi:hypothetical protein